MWMSKGPWKTHICLNRVGYEDPMHFCSITAKAVHLM
jgi:hypothetical protein